LERFNVPRAPTNNGYVAEEGEQSIEDEKRMKANALTPSSSFEERPAKREKLQHTDTESTIPEAPSTPTNNVVEDQTSITTTSSTTTETAPTARAS